MRKLAAITLGAFIASSLTAPSVFADGRTDYGAQFNQQRFFDPMQGARSFGMGGSTLPTTTDSSAVVGNPAGLGFMEKAEVSASYESGKLSGNDPETYRQIEQDSDRGHALAALPINPTVDGLPQNGSVGFGWSGFTSDSDDSHDTDTDGYAIHAAYGKNVSDKLSLGYGVSYQTDNVDFKKDRISVEMDDGVKQTVGAQYKSDDDTALGLYTFFGFGTDKVKSGGKSDDADLWSWGVAGGVEHTYPESQTVVGASLDYTKYGGDVENMFAWGVRTGVEQPIVEWFKVRAGYRYQAIFDYDNGDDTEDTAKYNAMSFGAGADLSKNLRADYGAEYRWVGDGDWTHLVSLSMPFSLCKEDWQK